MNTTMASFDGTNGTADMDLFSLLTGKSITESSSSKSSFPNVSKPCQNMRAPEKSTMALPSVELIMKDSMKMTNKSTLPSASPLLPSAETIFEDVMTILNKRPSAPTELFSSANPMDDAMKLISCHEETPTAEEDSNDAAFQDTIFQDVTGEPAELSSAPTTLSSPTNLMDDAMKLISHYETTRNLEENSTSEATQADEALSSNIMATLEPTPIETQGISSGYYTIGSLPSTITDFCDDYITVLSIVKAPQKNDEANASFPQLKTTSLIEDPNIHPYQNERWTERYSDLLDYYHIHGHFNVPYKQNPSLFQWVKRQRHQYKLRQQGHHSNLTAERIEMLRKVGFVWDSHRASWEEKFEELKEFKANNGHCFVPCLYNGSTKLSTWIKRQRRQYRNFISKQSSTLDEERIRRMEDLGFAWDYYNAKDRSN